MFLFSCLDVYVFVRMVVSASMCPYTGLLYALSLKSSLTYLLAIFPGRRRRLR